jgi:hypothetical protein
MRLLSAVSTCIIFFGAAAVYAEQSPATGTAPQAAAPAASTAAAPAEASGPSGLVKAALDTVDQTVGSLKMDKWKGGSVKTEASGNISSIQHDLHETLPGLLAAADAAPNSVSKLLPASGNIDALYDVLLRVFDAARVSAPGDQAAQLQAALSSLEKARHALDNRVQEAAAAQEKQLTDMRAKLQAQATPMCPAVPAAPACPAPAPAKKTTKKKAKPPATTPATPPTNPPATTPKN